MALSFTAGGAERVDVGSASNLDDLVTGTWLVWLRPANATPPSTVQVFNKNAGTVRLRVTTTALNSECGFATQNSSATALLSNCAAWGANKWVFAAGTWSNGTTPILAVGDLTTAAAEPSAYSAQTQGSGSRNTDAAGNMIIGNSSAATAGWDGDIAIAAIFNRAMTLKEIKTWQFDPGSLNGCVGFWILGANGTATQVDYSGKGNAGTVTSATVAPQHVPLGPLFGADPWAMPSGAGTNTVTKTVGTSGVLKKLGITKTVGTSAVVGVTGGGTKTVTTSAVLKKAGVTRSVSSSAVIGNAGSVGTPFMLYWARSLGGNLFRLERAVHYGNTGLVFNERVPTDDPYIFVPENTQSLWNSCRNMSDRYGYDFTFNEDGDCVLSGRNNPHYVQVLDATLGGAPTTKTNPSAYVGTYIEYTGAVSTKTKQVTAARIDLVLPTGPALGSWSVTVKRNSDGAVMSGPTVLTPTSTVDTFFYDGRASVDGTNACIVTVFSGYYDVYNVEITSSGGAGGTVRRLDSLMLWHTDAAKPLFPQSLTTDSNAVNVQAQSTMDEQRNYVIVVGKRRATVTDSSKLDSNPSNPSSEFVVQSAVDSASIVDPTADNYGGFPKESVIYDSSITDEDFAAYVARTFIYRQRMPRPSATVEHTILPVVQLRDPVYVVEGPYQTITAGSVLYVTGITHRIDKDRATTQLETTSYPEFPSYQPRDDIDIDTYFGGYPVANVNVSYTSLTNSAKSNLPSGVEYRSTEVGSTNDLVTVQGVSLTAGSPPYLDMTGKDWPPIPGTVFVRPSLLSTPYSYVTGVSGTTLSDSTQSWTTNQWVDYTVYIVAGTGAGQTRTVTSNTGTQLTVAAWTVNPDTTTSVYMLAPAYAGVAQVTAVAKQSLYSPGNASNGQFPKQRLENLMAITSVVVGEYGQSGSPYGGGTTLLKSYTLQPNAAAAGSWGYYTFDPLTQEITIIGTNISNAIPNTSPFGPYPNEYGATITWTANQQGTGKSWITNNPYHHIMNVDYRNATKRIYLPWKQGDTGGNTTGSISSSTTTSITVSGTPWTASAFIGMSVVLTSGSAIRARRTITSNTNNTINWTGALSGLAGGNTFSIEGAYDRNSQVNFFDVTYRRMGPVSGSNFSDPYTAGAPFFDPYQSEIGYLISVKFDALVSGVYRISVRSLYDDTIVAYLTEPTEDASQPEAHWSFVTAGTGKLYYWDGVDQVGFWNRRQSDTYANASAGEFEQDQVPIIGSGFYAWNREEKSGGVFPQLALISGLRDSTTSAPVFGQGTYSQWYVHFEAKNDTLQTIADAKSADPDPQVRANPQYQLPRQLKTGIRTSSRDGIDPTYHSAAIQYSGTANGGTAGSPNGTLTVATTPWTVNQWVGYYVFITGGTGAGQKAARIISNTSSALTINGSWTAPTGSTTFRIESHEALVYMHVPEPTMVELSDIFEWDGGGSWNSDTVTDGGKRVSGTDFDPTNEAGSGGGLNNSANWSQIAYTTANTVNPSAIINNQSPVLIRFAVMPRPGETAIWSSQQANVTVKLTRSVHLRATIHDQFTILEGTNYPGTVVEERRVVSRKLTNDDHTITFVDADYRKASTFKSAFSGTGTEWIFIPSDFKKDFRGLPDESIQFGEYLQLEEVPKWDATGQLAGARSRLHFAFMNYLFYLSAYTQDRSGRMVWCMNRKFLDKSKIIKNAYGDWWDPATPASPANSTTYRNTWPDDPMTQHRRTVVVRQWLDEKNWQSGQQTKFGFTAGSSIGDKLLRHKWEDHDPFATNLDGSAWPTLDTDDYSTWFYAVAGALDHFSLANSKVRQLGAYNGGSPTTRLNNWTWENPPYWHPSVTRDFHPYFMVPSMVDKVQTGRDIGAPDYRLDYQYFAVDARRYTSPTDPDRTNRNTGDDAASVDTWFSATRDDSETYVGSSGGQKRFFVNTKVTPKVTPTNTVQANHIDYQRQDSLVHYEDLRGTYTRGPRPQEQPKKISPGHGYYVNQMRYDAINVQAAYNNPAYPLYTTGMTVTAGCFDSKFRYEYVWENSALFPVVGGVLGSGVEALDALNINLMRVLPARGLSNIAYDGGAWTGWKDDAQVGTPGTESHANYKLFLNKANAFETGYMTLAVGPELLTTRDQYFALVLVNERRSTPLKLA